MLGPSAAGPFPEVAYEDWPELALETSIVKRPFLEEGDLPLSTLGVALGGRMRA